MRAITSARPSRSPEIVFAFASALAALGWILLAVLPGHERVRDLISGRIVPALLAAVYVVIVMTQWAGTPGGFGSLADVALLFSNTWLLLAGWVHSLAFDLLVGVWEARDARARGLPHLLLLPCLALTFLFGPAGWILYLAVRPGARRAR